MGRTKTVTLRVGQLNNEPKSAVKLLKDGGGLHMQLPVVCRFIRILADLFTSFSHFKHVYMFYC